MGFDGTHLKSTWKQFKVFFHYGRLTNEDEAFWYGINTETWWNVNGWPSIKEDLLSLQIIVLFLCRNMIWKQCLWILRTILICKEDDLTETIYVSFWGNSYITSYNTKW